MADNRETRLASVQSHSQEVLDFLAVYLPLANCHMSDFFINDLWNSCVPPRIQKQLVSVSDSDLMNILTDVTSLKACIDIETDQEADLKAEPPSVDYSGEHAAKSCARAEWHPPNWKHGCLVGYMEASQKVRLQNSDILDDLGQLKRELKCEVEKGLGRGLMTEKKSHEVDEMSRLVSCLCAAHDTHQVVDIGSGKGYLSSYLALGFNLQVLGIDSVSTNKEGALKRLKALRKHWFGSSHSRRNVRKREEEAAKKSEAILESVSSTTAQERSTQSSLSESEITDSNGGCQYWSSLDESQFHQIAQYVTPTTDIAGLFREAFSTADPRCSVVLTGLHTCGNLSCSTLRLFVQNPSASALCLVGCCYNLVDEQHCSNPFTGCPFTDTKEKPGELEAGFPLSRFMQDRRACLGRNARMLGVESIERGQAEHKLPSVSLYWRALLQELLLDNLGHVSDDWRVGRIATKCQSFLEYVRKCLVKLDMSGLSDKLSDEDIEGHMRRHEGGYERMMRFHVLRLAIAPAVESAIVVDRLLFLLEQPSVHEARVVRLFDPVTSPRCFALVAWKNSSHARGS